MRKYKNQNAITLVALVVTIVILLILAGISISALTNTGIFQKAKDAKQKAKDAELDQNTKLDEYESEINKYLPGITASTIANATDTEKATNYYGKSVSYESVNGVTGWKIFYAGKMTDSIDATNNIYLIADDYVDITKLPKGTNENGQSVGSAPENTNSSWPKVAPFDNIIPNYAGASRITTDTIKNLNTSFFERNDVNTNTNDNMKAVAYMLDTIAWSTFKDDNGKADYAIGGPTLEMLFKSYNQKHPGKNYEAQATSTTGYQLRVNRGTWKHYTDSSSEYLNSNDSLYVLPTSNGANAMWVSSPSAYNSYRVMHVTCNGSVGCNGYGNADTGFRPLICLNSNVQLQKSGDGFIIK